VQPQGPGREPLIDPGFAPRDLTDGRAIGDFRTRYTARAARWGIGIEAAYLAAVFVAVPVLLTLIYVRVYSFGLGSDQFAVVSRYSYAWLGGTLGGTLFSIKWLYHTVAHGSWNEDRRLWRLFTPHVSAGLAFAVAVLLDSHVLTILDSRVIGDARTVIGVSFLVGYFSDSAIARLADVAKNIFGSSKRSAAQAPTDDRTAEEGGGGQDGGSETAP
jgi:hypothetical protein